MQLKAPSVFGYEINIGGKVVKDCGAPCNSLFFDDKEVTTLRYNMSTINYLKTVITFMITYQFLHIFFFSFIDIG